MAIDTTLDVPQDRIEKVAKFMRKSTLIYERGSDRRHALRPLLDDILGCSFETIEKSSGPLSDTTVLHSIHGRTAIILVVDFVNEAGNDRSDATAQAAVSFYRSWINNPEVRVANVCPIDSHG